jgi:RNA polymerase sigma-70 factor (ECF subfamily)
VAERSDEELMHALAGDDLAAFDALFRRHYETVRTLCARVTASDGSSDDLAQETFLRVLRHRATFRGDARFTTWIYRIARNVCLEQLARQARDRRLAERWTAETARTTSDDRSDDNELLVMALRSLTAEQREVLVLCRYHDLPFTEIGAILGCTAGAARVRAHRALSALRDAYQRIHREGEARNKA